MTQSSKIYLGLGSNLGDRQSNIVQALQQMKSQVTVEEGSSFYETEPVGYLDQPRFINAVCRISTQLPPLELLHFLKRIERRMGRQPSFRDAPRPIDIDILFYDDLVIESPELTIPHPRLPQRAFMLVPLAEIAPDLIHPVLKIPIAELLKGVDSSGVKKSRAVFKRP